ncbi:hypothetical protein BH683_000580 [Williamsia sp. 1138]|nr:hypothetical protein BH683_000580 [Williamsia sp. 1138]
MASHPRRAGLFAHRAGLFAHRAGLFSRRAGLRCIDLDGKGTIGDQKSTVDDQKGTIGDQKSTIDVRKGTIGDGKGTIGVRELPQDQAPIAGPMTRQLSRICCSNEPQVCAPVGNTL